MLGNLIGSSTQYRQHLGIFLDRPRVHRIESEVDRAIIFLAISIGLTLVVLRMLPNKRDCRHCPDRGVTFVVYIEPVASSRLQRRSGCNIREPDSYADTE